MAVPGDLEQGLAAHRAGQWELAEKHYRRAVKLPALRRDALHLLGLLHIDLGRPQDALPILTRAVALAPEIIAYRLTKARCEYQLGQFQAAASTLLAVPARASIDPRTRQQLADGMTAAGLGLRDTEGAVAALPVLRAALAFSPDQPGLMCNLGLTLVLAGQAEEAIGILESARDGAPQDREIWLALSGALIEAGRDEQAEELLRTACLRFPEDVRFAGNLATALQEQGRLEEALDWSRRALVDGDASGRRLFNHANILYGLERWSEAAHAYDAALSGGYDDAVVLFNRGKARLTTNPASVDGWSDYSRRHLSSVPLGAGQLLRPPATLEPGRKICLLAEQGLGDQLFFLRWVPSLLASGIEVALALDGKLRGLLQDSVGLPWFDDAGQAVAAGFTTLVWLGDLPILAQRARDEIAIPPPIPLKGRGAEGRLPYLGAHTGCDRLIGLTWRAGQPGRNRLSKEVPLDSLLNVLVETGDGIVCLQRNPTVEEMEHLRRRLGSRLVDCSAFNETLADMAAVLAMLDVYVTVSNTNLHIAESTGRVESFVLVPRPFFTWGADGNRSPWFPNSTVFRRMAGTGWDATMASLSRALSGQ